jgi:hypothetical protein
MGRRKVDEGDIFPVDRRVYRVMLALLKEAGSKEKSEAERDAEYLAECRYFELLGRAHAYDPGFFANAEEMAKVRKALEARKHLWVRPIKKPDREESPLPA